MDGVPEFVPPDRAWFDVLPSGLAHLVVNLQVEALRDLPLPTTDQIASEVATALAGWQLMTRATMTVIDGPGDLGFLVSVPPTELDTSATWVDATVEHGGAIVHFMRIAEAGGEGDARVRGGFIRIVD
jgi:hypothetical protein